MWPRMHRPMGHRMPMMPVQMSMPPMMQQMNLGHMAAAGAMMGIAAPYGGMGMQMPYHMQMAARFGFQPSPLDAPFASQFDVPPIVGYPF